MTFEHSFTAGWAHMDANGHMRNTAFIDLAVDVRLLYLASAGFGLAEMTRHAVGPVVRRDDIEFYREFRLLDSIRITLTSAGMSEDGSRFMMRNDFHRADGTLGARLTTTGGWLDLRQRALTAPPPALLAALRALDRTDDFTVLRSSLRGR
jgi:acyl-CoA thioester hydrolase